MIPLLAQLVAPPLQNSPVRLPGQEAGEERLAPQQPRPPALQIEGQPAPGGLKPSPVPPSQGNRPLPEIQGLSRYSPAQLQAILASCAGIADPRERLQSCAAALTARLIADGYVNSRVYVRTEPAPGRLEVVEGRVVEIRVLSDDAWLARRVRRLLAPLQGGVLQVAQVERNLQLLRIQNGVGEVRGNLSRLGSDPAQAVLTVQIKPNGNPWQGDLSLRNDGNNGSGEFRGVATLLKPSLISRGDTLLLYGELDATDRPQFGSLISSLSYTLPLADQLNLTGAFGYSRRNLVELPAPSDGLSTGQYQGLGQLEWVFRETMSQRWSLFAAYSANRSNTYLDGAPLPSVLPASVRNPASGYVRLGVAGNAIAGRLGVNGNAYLLQGVAAATPADQRQELARAGLNPGQATALGGVVSAAWRFAPGWQLNLRGAGQVAFQPLLSSMQFSLGSDVGLRGLPGQLISGDNGLLGSAETVWTAWQKRNQALQLVPFIGAGLVSTTIADVSFRDTVGSGGLLARWLAGPNFSAELGWVGTFNTNNNVGPWRDWLLGDGLYVRLGYRF